MPLCGVQSQRMYRSAASMSSARAPLARTTSLAEAAVTPQHGHRRLTWAPLSKVVPHRGMTGAVHSRSGTLGVVSLTSEPTLRAGQETGSDHGTAWLARRRLPAYGWLGLGLTGVFWALNWGLDGMRTHWGFFPMWLGYCLTVDALVVARKGTSLLRRSVPGYVGLFLVSMPAWWLFELANERTRNWVYLSDGSIVGLRYFVLASLSFSTVIPAVFGTAELAGTWSWIRRIGGGPRLEARWPVLAGMAGCGLLMAVLVLAWPRYFFPCVWTAGFLIVEPLNAMLGHRSLLDQTGRGEWRGVVALCVGCLVCGWFWEMWNYWSFPKWEYHVPWVGWCHVFEMPLLGYGGYLPFALELHALYHLFVAPFARGRERAYVDLITSPDSSPSVQPAASS